MCSPLLLTHRLTAMTINHYLRSRAHAFTRASIHRSRHTLAIAREIPISFINAVVAHSTDHTAVSLDLARKQHRDYLSALRQHVPTLSLPPIEKHPDCLFVEDTVVAIGETAVIAQLGHSSRRDEADSIREVLQQLGMKHVYDMRDNDDNQLEGSFCDGGDVMYTGRHLFVGMSDRTNFRGYQFVREVFARHGIPVDDIISIPSIVTGKEVLHLKSAVTHIDETTLLAPEGSSGDAVLQAMKSFERGYCAIRLPNLLSCNAVVVNGHVLAQDSSCIESRKRIKIACKERNLGLTFVDTSELAKKDGALTCCSVLLSISP